MNAHHVLDARLSALYRAYAHSDPAPERVKPLPIQILHHAQAVVDAAPSLLDTAALDLAWLGYFFLLRPGEHCHAKDNALLRLHDVKLLIGRQPLDLLRCPEADLFRASHISLYL